MHFTVEGCQLTVPSNYSKTAKLGSGFGKPLKGSDLLHWGRQDSEHSVWVPWADTNT